MKKGSKDFKAGDLIVDILDYAFTEWLVRQGIFVAFKANYDASVSPYGCFRDRLRAHIRRSLCSPSLDPTYLISTAFLFDSTPEGYDFWRKHSAAWKLFFLRFQSKL